MFNFSDDNPLTIENIFRKVKVSTTIRDKSGAIVAELSKNQWRVWPPKTFDRNYTDDTLEVRRSDGNIVLQVRVLPDRVQLQGEWRSADGRGIRLVKAPGGGGVIVIRRGEFERDDPKIKPIFRYPSDSHFRELLAP
jgi:hypothetical protein